jgi:hypothetical protein
MERITFFAIVVWQLISVLFVTLSVLGFFALVVVQ